MTTLGAWSRARPTHWMDAVRRLLGVGAVVVALPSCGAKEAEPGKPLLVEAGPSESFDAGSCPSPGAVAADCECPNELSSICLGAPLFCRLDPASAALRWSRGEDGPCMPRAATTCEGVLPSASECIAEFIMCIELDTGAFCGGGPFSDDCPGVRVTGECESTDGDCVTLTNGQVCLLDAPSSCPDGWYVAPGCGADDATCVTVGAAPNAFYCAAPRLAEQECSAADGTQYSDPGDGSLFREGCPDGAALLGITICGDEGCLCCAQ